MAELDSTAGADVIKKEKVKQGPVGAKGKGKVKKAKTKPAPKK